jgi:hypothetical protein
MFANLYYEICVFFIFLCYSLFLPFGFYISWRLFCINRYRSSLKRERRERKEREGGTKEGREGEKERRKKGKEERKNISNPVWLYNSLCSQLLTNACLKL